MTSDHACVPGGEGPVLNMTIKGYSQKHPQYLLSLWPNC